MLLLDACLTKFTYSYQMHYNSRGPRRDAHHPEGAPPPYTAPQPVGRFDAGRAQEEDRLWEPDI